jgi:hypothetical protein
MDAKPPNWGKLGWRGGWQAGDQEQVGRNSGKLGIRNEMRTREQYYYDKETIQVVPRGGRKRQPLSHSGVHEPSQAWPCQAVETVLYHGHL